MFDLRAAHNLHGGLCAVVRREREMGGGIEKYYFNKVKRKKKTIT